MYEFAPYRILPVQRQLFRDGVPVKLGGRAFDVLVALIERRSRTVSKNELMDLVWTTVVVEENNLDVQIFSLRKLLGYAAIVTVPGRGYRFTLSVTQTGTDEAPATPQEPHLVEKFSRSNLPENIPTLYGRDEDLQRVQSLLLSHRLVTVAGPAGIGKTRLAQAAAEACRGSTGDSIWWVDLAPMTNPALIPSALAVALGLSLDGASDAFNAVLAALTGRTPLVVLDNAEHLLDGVASFVLRLLREVPGTRFLITSQEPLRVDDEFVFRLEPLSLPSSDDPERIADSGAVALFVARAQAAERRFELRSSNEAVVAEICRRLDGIPLAIELAAARVPLLGIEGLRDKLDQRFHVLIAGRRSSLRRHQTLRAALEWSHQLLEPAQQIVLRRLGVFAGGFTLEAAQQVAEDGQGIDNWDVLEHLGALVDKSLVVAEGDSVPRYRMLETTRLFALERLIESGESEDVRGRHRDHYLALAEECEPKLLLGETRRHLTRLDVERDNLFLALAWAPRADDARLGLRLVAAMRDYWFMRAMPARGAEVTRAALERPGAEVPSPDRCRALVAAGWMSMWSGAHAEAVRDLAEALALARGFSEPSLLCLVLARFAHVHFHHGEVEAAANLASEAVDVGRRRGDSVELGYALMLRAHVHARAEEYEAARRLFLEALAARERMNNRSGMVAVHLSLARLLVDQECLREAKSHLDRALALLAQADSRYEALALIGMTAQWAAATGHPEVALLLHAARNKQFSLAGFNISVIPRDAERIEHARLALSSHLAEQLANAGSALGYDQSIQRVQAFLAQSQ
jgi:predicted ATPase/DNA-binding winged helix-turn-helix (wHTH) protein